MLRILLSAVLFSSFALAGECTTRLDKLKQEIEDGDMNGIKFRAAELYAHGCYEWIKKIEAEQDAKRNKDGMRRSWE